MTALAQFYFDPAGGVGQAIDLPWGHDFPDINLTLPDPDHLPLGFEEASPEPATFGLIGLPLCAAAMWRRYRRSHS